MHEHFGFASSQCEAFSEQPVFYFYFCTKFYFLSVSMERGFPSCVNLQSLRFSRLCFSATFAFLPWAWQSSITGCYFDKSVSIGCCRGETGFYILLKNGVDMIRVCFVKLPGTYCMLCYWYVWHCIVLCACVRGTARKSIACLVLYCPVGLHWITLCNCANGWPLTGIYIISRTARNLDKRLMWVCIKPP